ncbi:hypothetical protein F4678DRAFT_457076 [Xylaria arbuscula]|nr:hypothetical protein F4678DRAFT_457076 [Xylaria arbuscula]
MLGFGWSEDLLLFGYHSDDGDVYPAFFRPSSRGMAGGQHFPGIDSTVGCGFNYEERTMYFTKSGEYLGIVFVNVLGARLYPAIFTSTSQIGMEFIDSEEHDEEEDDEEEEDNK